VISFVPRICLQYATYLSQFARCATSAQHDVKRAHGEARPPRRRHTMIVAYAVRLPKALRAPSNDRVHKILLTKHELISHKVFLNSFYKSRFPHKYVNLFFISVIVKDKLTNLRGGVTSVKRHLKHSDKSALTPPADMCGRISQPAHRGRGRTLTAPSALTYGRLCWPVPLTFKNMFYERALRCVHLWIYMERSFLDISGFIWRGFLAHPCLHETTDRILLEPQAYDGARLQPVVVQHRSFRSFRL
jgi:hypothetical protein